MIGSTAGGCNGQSARYTHLDITRTKPAITALDSAFDGERKRQQEKQDQERATANPTIETVQPPTVLVQ